MMEPSSTRRANGRVLCVALLASGLSACVTVTPPTQVHQPMTVRPEPRPMPQTNNGAIWQAGYARPLFEDRRARLVGDTIIIQIVEKTQAVKKSSTGAERSSSMKAGLPTLAGLPGKRLLGLGLEAENESKFAGKGDSSATYDFNGTIAVTVAEVLPNGNLIVTGEKMVAINQGEEFVRFSGVVNPANVSSTNTVQSTYVADAKVEYRGTGSIDASQTMGWMQRVFLSVLPF